MKVLIACEESQAVCIEFRILGHEAYSCDILPCSGGHPEWHIQGDVLEQLDKGWDMMLAFPPCTFLTLARNKYFKPEYDERFPNQHKDREAAVLFFMELVNAPIEKICIENPIGIMSTRYKPSTQIIQPYYFGDPERKSTGLWLKNLPRLVYSLYDNLFDSKTSVEPKLYTYKNGKTDGMWHVLTMQLRGEERK